MSDSLIKALEKATTRKAPKKRKAKRKVKRKAKRRSSKKRRSRKGLLPRSAESKLLKLEKKASQLALLAEDRKRELAWEKSKRARFASEPKRTGSSRKITFRRKPRKQSKSAKKAEFLRRMALGRARAKRARKH